MSNGPKRSDRYQSLLHQAQLDLWRLGHRHTAWWPCADSDSAVESWCAQCGEYATVEPLAIGRAETRGVTLYHRCDDLKRWAEARGRRRTDAGFPAEFTQEYTTETKK